MRDKTASFKVGQNHRFVIIQIASLCEDKKVVQNKKALAILRIISN